MDDDEVLNKTIEIYSYKFPDNSIYVGFTSYGVENMHYNHSKKIISPIYNKINEYPNIEPKIELIVENKSYKDLYKITRQIFDKNPNMKILNVNLCLYGY